MKLAFLRKLAFNPLRLLPRRIPYRGIFWTIFFSMIIGSAAILGGLIGWLEAQPPVEELVYYKPPQSTLVFDSQEKVPLAEFSAERRYTRTYEQMPRQLINAFLSIEDRRFWEHCGVDPIGIIRAIVRNAMAGHKVEGASTITMQLAGNTIKGIDRSEMTYGRKIDEALKALLIERNYTKEQIIEFYLNQIAFGGVNFGVEAAAQTYFRKSLGQLTLAECAMIAGIPKAPSKLNPAVNPEKALARRNVVLAAMFKAGYISRQQYEQARNEPLPDRMIMRSSDSLYRAPYFIDYLEDSLLDNAHFLEMARRAKKTPVEYIKTEGLRVVSTLDPQLQRIAEEAVRKGVVKAEMDWHNFKDQRRASDEEESTSPKAGQERIGEILDIDDATITVSLVGYRGKIPRPAVPALYNWQSILKKGELLDVRVDSVDREKRTFEGIMLPQSKIKSAMAVIEARTGRVVALVGGDNYYDRSESKSEWNFATQGGRQPGSGIKPLFYAAAVHKGMKPDQTFHNVPFNIGDYRGRNYSPTYEGGMMTMQEGLERSQNVMMLRVFQATGFKYGVEFVKRFDFAWSNPQWKGLEEVNAALCLGTFDVTPLEIAAAYTVFANEGIGIRPYAVEKIINREGEVIYSAMPEKRSVLTPQEAFVMVSMMRGVFGPRGTARDIGERFAELEDLEIPQMAGKTGTTSEVRDVWFNGFTPDLVCSVFVGFDPPRPMGGKGFTGSTLAGPIWEDFMKEALAIEGREWEMEFSVPPSLQKKIVNLQGVEVPEWRQDDEDAGEDVMEIYLQNGQEPE